MTHPRKIIRQAVVDAIKAAGTMAQDRVWAGEQPPIDVPTVLSEEGPVILVYTRRDRAEEYSASGTEYVKRKCDLCIEIIAAEGYAVDDTLDDCAEQVEVLIDGFSVPGLPATEIRLHETNVETSDQFEKPVGGAFLTYDVEYWKPWRVEPTDGMDCPGDVGVVVNGGPRQVIDVSCDCEHP